MKFFVVNNTRFAKGKFAYGHEVGESNVGEAIYCKECNKPLTMLDWLPPYKIRAFGKKLGDVIFGTYSGFIISSRLKQMAEAEGIVGFETFTEVQITNRGNGVIDQYYYPKIALGAAQIDLDASGLIFKGAGECSICQRKGRPILAMKGLVFKDPIAIQEDIFRTMMIGGILVSDRFRNLLIENQFTNLSFIESSTYVPEWLLIRP